MHNFYESMELNKMWLHNMGNNGMKFLWQYSFLFYFIYNNLFLYLILFSSLSILFSREALIVILDFIVI